MYLSSLSLIEDGFVSIKRWFWVVLFSLFCLVCILIVSLSAHTGTSAFVELLSPHILWHTCLHLQNHHASNCIVVFVAPSPPSFLPAITIAAIIIVSTQHHHHCLRLCLFAMSDQCALDESGGLKEAKDIEFFFSESETMPLASSAALSQQNPANTGKSYTPLFL